MMTAVADNPTQIMQQSCRRENFTFLLIISMQGSQLFKEPSDQEADMIGMLFFVKIISGKI